MRKTLSNSLILSVKTCSNSSSLSNSVSSNSTSYSFETAIGDDDEET